jgi:prepilin-type N-terminal cleavage/methylation domain-containing protein
MRKAAGFTLIELMIVVSIIAIIAAIMIPSLLRSRVHANEASAVENLRVLQSAQTSYFASKKSFGDFAMLTADTPRFLNGTWSQGIEKSGYLFEIESATEGNFVCYADPVALNITGTRYFRMDSSGVIRWNSTGRPGANDTALGSE